MADINKVPARRVWKFVRGDTVSNPFRVGTRFPGTKELDYWDLTGWTIQGEIRATEDSETVLTTITGTVDPVQVNETKGAYTLEIADSSVLPDKSVGDVEFVNTDGDILTLQRFQFQATKDVTRITP